MNETCPNCRVRLANDNWRERPVRFSTRGPWGSLHELWTGQCYNCNHQIRSLIRDFDPVPVAWLVADEKLGWYNVQYRSGAPESQDYDVYWCWHPFRGVAGVDALAFDAVTKLLAVQSRPATLVGVDQSGLVMYSGLGGRVCKSVILGEGILQDQVGPFPSVRAELTLKATFPGAVRIYHLWPAASLPHEDYIPLESDDLLPMLWAKYKRQSLHVTVNKEIA